MGVKSSKKTVEEILDIAGIQIGGNEPYDIQVHNPKMYKRVLAQHSLGLGESYMDGWWDCNALDQFFDRLLRAEIDRKVTPSADMVLQAIKARVFNLQKVKRSFHIGKAHYDIGNDIYIRMLDKRMNYSCGFWRDADTLEKAQEAKLELICRKMGLDKQKGLKVLDIGCGWGSFAQYAAEKYEAEVVGITVSKEQVKLARENCQGLPIYIRFQDYRDLNEKFDRIVSVGMFEHVGVKNYRRFMKKVRRYLKNDGLFLLHTIGGNRSVKLTDPWIGKYIFPNSMLPSVSQIARASEGLFVQEHFHSFGQYYDPTLLAWHRNFNYHWDEIKDNYGERFKRMWDYYILCCAGSFRARKNQVWQIVYSKNGVKGGYPSDW
ncbi:MAG: cyclopropane fatty acyl phospholipid synthase [Candidatus Woesearchaeota archaeon]